MRHISSMVLNNELLPAGSLADGGVLKQAGPQQSGSQMQQQHAQQPMPALQLPPLDVPLLQTRQQQAAALQLPPLAAPQLQQPQQLLPPLLGPQHLLDPGDEKQQQQQQQQQTGAADQTAPPQSAAAAAGDVDAVHPLACLEDELDDDFFNDLLAIFDEAEGLQPEAAQDTKEAAPAALKAEAAAAACGSVVQPAPTPAAAGAAAEDQQASAAKQQLHPQQQQRPAVAVPLAVKAGVVFMLHCLHETQLNMPPVAIYTSLQHLQLLQQAAAQFAAAGAAGADVLGVLQLLLKQQRLLVGQFRRPVHWVPQLPAWLAPPKPRYPDLGVGLAAANRAAARAHNGARVAAVLAAANAARSLRANPRSVDPVVHREALFHIKTALRSLANFRSLQELCSKYADARQAIFEPLLRIKEPVVNVAQQQQQQSAQEKQQQAQEQQQQLLQGCKRGGSGKPDSSSKRSKQTDKQAVDRSQKYLQRLQEQQQQQQLIEIQQRQAAAAAEAARAAGIPELFDRSFAANLSQLAGDEAAQMLVLLDPGKNPAYVRHMLKQQQQALEEADAAQTAAAGRDSNARLRALASGLQQPRAKAGSSKQAARGAGAAGAAAVLRQQQQQQGWQYLQDLCAAGVLHPAELQELQEDESEGSVQGFGAAGQVLQLQRQRRQHTLVLAEQWFRSHDALMMQSDDDADMP
jgi:hypothetical protein